MEVAFFHPDDPEELVHASLACSMCLGGDVEWTAGEDDVGPVVTCACRGCGHERRMGLTDGQALRLALAALPG